MKKKFTKTELLTLLKDHKDQITSMGNWNKYSKENGLPHTQTLISYFGSWNKFKAELSLELNDQFRPQKYTDKDLYDILEQYKEHYTSATEWDVFAEERGLPKHFIFMERFGPKVLQERIGLILNWTDDNIKRAILQHFPDSPPTIVQWSELTKTEQVPSKMTIIRHYRTWNQMKYEVYYK